MKKIVLFGITFFDCDFNFISQKFDKKGYITIPSGPGLSEIEDNEIYKNSLINSSISIFDSSLLCFLLKFKGINVSKFSGYKFLYLFFNFIKKNSYKILLVDPTSIDSKLNLGFLNKINNCLILKSYIAPIYNKNNFSDMQLVNTIDEFEPNFIIINLGGFTQEPLAHYLSKKIKSNSFIICSGAAISFFTGRQAKVNSYTDNLYLGWLIRCISNPRIFVPRYFKALKLIKIFIKNKKKVYVEDI